MDHPCDLRPLDLADDAVMHRVAALAQRVHAHERPHASAFSERAFLGQLRSPDSGEQMFAVTAHDGDEVVGFGLAWIYLLDNPDIAWLEVKVDPDHGGLGVGTAVLDHLTEQVRAEGRTTLMAEAKIPFDERETHPYRVFAEHRGYAFSNVEVVRHQPIPVPEADLVAWGDRAAVRAGDYRIETWVNEVPEELQESLCTLIGLLGVDAPTGAVDFEEETITPERLAEMYATAEAMGRDRFETLAIAPDGTVAAQSTISAPRDTPDAYQYGTYVHREHRGHSLGLAVKVANLRAVQAAHPHLRRVITQNAETNQWMIAVNELMGYQPVEASMEFVRRF